MELGHVRLAAGRVIECAGEILELEHGGVYGRLGE